jgi:cation/acetate symporter
MTVHPFAVGIFVFVVVITLGITAWASRHARQAAQFYAAGGSITAWQNGLAIAGDYLSAASFLGTVAAFFSVGIDGILYAVGAAAGWPVVVCLTAERLRNLGRFTFSDVLCHRLADGPVRTLTVASTLCICGSYLVAQIVGAGALVQVLFGVPYAAAVTLVGVLMIVYVMLGGMVATTWIQIVKASVLLVTALVMVLLVFSRVDHGLLGLANAAAAARGSPDALLAPKGLVKDWVSAAGLALAFLFGPAGLPHILMRFFTVRDGRSARRSLAFAGSLIALFQIMVVVLGFGTIAFITHDPRYVGADGKLFGGANMAVVHLAHFLAGTPLFGIVAAVTFATILAVVSGLTLATASAISHDLYNHVLHRGRAREQAELRVSRIACVGIGAFTVALGLLFQQQNVAFLGTLPLAIAASSNFPILMLAMYWPRLTTAGAVAGGLVGLVLSVGLVVLSPKVWVDTLHHAAAPFPYEYPTLISLPLAFLTAWAVSLATGGRAVQRAVESRA